jgi:translation initiation factor 3 subunit E
LPHNWGQRGLSSIGHPLFLTPPPLPTSHDAAPPNARTLSAQSIQELGIYERKSVLTSVLTVCKRTKLTENALRLFADLHDLPEGPVGPALVGALPPAAQAELKQLQDADARCVSEMAQCLDAMGQVLRELVGVHETPPQLTQLKEEGKFHLEYLVSELGITEQQVDAMYTAAKMRYETGDYVGSYAYLALYEELKYPKQDDVPLEVSWGKFASALMGDDMLAQADQEMEYIAKALRVRGPLAMTDSSRLQQRTWLLHWGLFLLANYPVRRDALIEFYMQEENMMCMCLTCPWLLRYIIASVLGSNAGPNKRFRYAPKTILRTIAPEVAQLRDPFVAFLRALLVDFDFEAGNKIIRDCQDAIATDIFLDRIVGAAFLASARGFLFDVYCRVHQKIDLRTLAVQVDMSEEDVEKWVVGLIRSAALDAKVDSTSRTVEMMQTPHSL